MAFSYFVTVKFPAGRQIDLVSYRYETLWSLSIQHALDVSSKHKTSNKDKQFLKNLLIIQIKHSNLSIMIFSCGDQNV